MKPEETKKGPSFIFIIIAIILGTTLYKQFDFKTGQFEHAAMAVIYGLTFLACVALLIKDYRARSKK